MTDAASGRPSASGRSRPSSTDRRGVLRLILGAVLALSVVAFVLQITMVRPFLWPAGAGLTLSGDSVLVSFAAPRASPRTRPPDISAAAPEVVVTDVRPGSEAAGMGIASGARVDAIQDDSGYVVDLKQGLPADAAALLTRWRAAYWLGPRGPITLTVRDADAARDVTLERHAVWRVDADARGDWLRAHGGALVQMGAFIAGAIVLLALGTSGMTGALMTLTLVLTAVANGGALLGAERTLPLGRELLVLFGWLATPLAFPVIGLAVLYFPSKAAVLERHRWIVPGLVAAAAPMFVISLLAALFLLGADSMLPPLAWLSSHAWVFDASFAVALAANVLIVVEGIGRYRGNPDANERRRIQLIVFTGVPAVFAYAIRVFVPLLSSLAGRPIALHWFVEALLTVVVVLPALALPYAVAVKHVFSPRTVLRRGLQYALARRTLSILILLPIAALVMSLIAGRDRPLSDIVLGQPIFFVICLALAAAGLRYRDDAQRWLDQRFFRAEYDAREILVSLASRVPYETDPRELVAMVLTQIDSALHPESVAVLAGDGDRLEVISALRASVDPLPREDALVTLLRWSDEPLEVFLDDERSPAARLPHSDRQWLERSHASLLVPIFTGTGDPPSLAGQRNASSGEAGGRALVGIVVLGEKRSEEPYTAEDRRLLGGIAAQMSIALDLSRLRRTASARSSPPREAGFTIGTPTRMEATTGSPAALLVCPCCSRCFGLEAGPRCPDEGEELQVIYGMPPVVDGKYRVDAVIGKGGMGAVFRAHDLRLDRDVAIKIVRADLVADPEARARFRREAQIVARLQHPAVVTVFDYGNLADGAAFLVMEYVRGEDLRTLLRREQTVSHERTVDLMSGVAMGVEAAHQAGVLHRDLKPENVLLPASGAGPKVLDFGVAKITDASGAGGTLTQGATVIGTPAYMSPEQLRGDVLDGRADVYSLGVMTYELLTGQLPFGMGSFIDVGINQAGGAANIDITHVPRPLTVVLLRALAANRDGRPGSAAAFAAELRTRN